MKKVKVIEDFTLKDYKSIKEAKKDGKYYPMEITDKGARFFKGVEFVCNEKMFSYLTGGNKLNKTFVEIIEEEKETRKGRKKNGK